MFRIASTGFNVASSVSATCRASVMLRLFPSLSKDFSVDLRFSPKMKRSSKLYGLVCRVVAGTAGAGISRHESLTSAVYMCKISKCSFLRYALHLPQMCHSSLGLQSPTTATDNLLLLLLVNWYIASL